MKGRDKKADLLEDLETKEQHSGEYSGFSFCFIYLRHGIEKTDNPGTVNINKNTKNKIILTKGFWVFSPTKESGKGRA